MTDTIPFEDPAIDDLFGDEAKPSPTSKPTSAPGDPAASETSAPADDLDLQVSGADNLPGNESPSPDEDDDMAWLDNNPPSRPDLGESDLRDLFDDDPDDPLDDAGDQEPAGTPDGDPTLEQEGAADVDDVSPVEDGAEQHEDDGSGDQGQGQFDTEGLTGVTDGEDVVAIRTDATRLMESMDRYQTAGGDVEMWWWPAAKAAVKHLVEDL